MMMATKWQVPGSAAHALRQARPGWAALLLVLALAACSASGGAASSGLAATSKTASAPAGSAELKVTSTLDGHTALPHQIHWQAFPSESAADITEADFLIDGKLAWVEHVTPYFYGDDGNWLVTSFLTPGTHTFTVRVINIQGRTATDTDRASVTAPSAPPAGLAGTWTRTVTPADIKKATSNQPPPAGHWALVIGPVGWQLHDPTGGGMLFDIGYGRGGNLQMRPTIEYPPYPNGNNGGFCEDADPVWAWTYSVRDGGKTLTLHPAGHDPCGDRIAILAGTWTRGDT
jgi:hypothetical protein